MFERDAERREWAREQMGRAFVPDPLQSMIEKMLDVYWPGAASSKIDPTTAAHVLRTFTELAQGHALVADEPDAVWVPAKRGALVVRDIVRVAPDAYSGPAGIAHNAREGVVVAIRYGDVHVRYTDGREPNPDFVRHSPYMLEKRIR